MDEEVGSQIQNLILVYVKLLFTLICEAIHDGALGAIVFYNNLEFDPHESLNFDILSR